MPRKVHEQKSTGVIMHGVFRKQQGARWSWKIRYVGIELGGEVET